jgi:hypothetical protein
MPAGPRLPRRSAPTTRSASSASSPATAALEPADPAPYTDGGRIAASFRFPPLHRRDTVGRASRLPLAHGEQDLRTRNTSDEHRRTEAQEGAHAMPPSHLPALSTARRSPVSFESLGQGMGQPTPDAYFFADSTLPTFSDVAKPPCLAFRRGVPGRPLRPLGPRAEASRTRRARGAGPETGRRRA